MSEDVDLLVVGAGPGGSNAAAVALEAGLRVTLVEAARLPRVKPCAGGMTIKATRALAETLALEPSVRCRFQEFEFNLWDARRQRYEGVPRLLTMVHRPDFDHALVRQNLARGLALFDGEPARDLDWDGRRFTLRTERRRLRAPQLVVADGAHGRIGRSLGLARPAGRAAAVEIVLRRDEARIPEEPRTRFDFALLPRGYGWVFPKDDHWSVGLYTLGGPRRLRALLADYVQALGFEVRGEPLQSFEGHTIPLGGHRLRASDRPAYLVGDAVGLADALTGEGIFHALESGRLAGETAVDVAAGRARPADYRRRLRRRLLPDAFLTWRAAQIFYEHIGGGLSLLRRGPIWRTFVHGYGEGATFAESVARGLWYAPRSRATGRERIEIARF